MAKTAEELQQETNELLRQLANRSSGGVGGGDGTNANKQAGLLATAFDKTVAGVSKLGSGTASTSDVLNVATGIIGKFGGAGQAAAGILKELGDGAINVNNTLKETGKFGISFGQNLGEANLAIKGAQLTLPEFQNLIQQNGKSLAGLAGGQNESAKTFLSLSREMQGTTFAQDLKAAGMSSLELNDAMLTVARTSGPVNMNDLNARRQLIASSLQLADEMNKTADLSGKSRKQQEAEIAAIQARADVQAATLAAMRTDPQFGTRMTEATASMSKFGPKIEELLAEEATLGGARSDDALNTKAMMGSAGAAIAEYGKAIKSGNAEEIAIAKERAERAIAAKLADQKFNETIAVTQGNVLNGGALVAGSYDTTKNIIAKQADVLAKTGKHIDEYEAIKLLEKEGALRTKGKTPEGKIDEGAVVGRTINQIDNLGKVVGGTMAQGFNKLNTELGQTISTHLPALNAKLKAMGSPEGFKSEVSSTTSGAINSVASKLGAKIVPKDDKTRELLNKGPTSIRKETAPANESGATTPAANAPESSSSSVMTELRDFFSQLNTKMDDLIRHSSSTADSAQKQVRATESLSGNRLG